MDNFNFTSFLLQVLMLNFIWIFLLHDLFKEDDQTTSTTNASTPTPNFLSAIPPTTLPDVLVTAHTPVNHMIQSSSPTPSTSSGSGLPSLKFIEDESLFDLDALTCHACNKSFKNTRAFKLHRDRHQGALKHKVSFMFIS